MKIGENIVRLRKEKNLTQEQLAEVLGVSVAAVSKWETGAACPDIELIPEIAKYFKVSVDYLLGYDMTETENHIDESIEKAMRLYFDKKRKEALERMSSLAARHPNNVKVLIAHAKIKLYSTYGNNAKDWHRELLREAENILLSLPENGMTRAQYEEAQYLLSQIYTIRKQYDEALEIIRKLKRNEQVHPEEMEYILYMEKGDCPAAIRLMQKLLYLSLQNMLHVLAHKHSVYNDRPDKIIEQNELAIQLIQLFAKDEPSHFDKDLSVCHETIALTHARQKNREKALEHFEKAVGYAIRNNDPKYKDNVLPPVFDALTDTMKPRKYNAVQSFLDALDSNERQEYDLLRNEPRFIAAVDRLKKAIQPDRDRANA